MTTATHYHHLTEDEISRFWEDGFLVVDDQNAGAGGPHHHPR